MKPFKEKDLEIMLPENTGKHDQKGKRLPPKMKFVDFIVRNEDQSKIIMIEMKDPSTPKAPQSEIDKWDPNQIKNVIRTEVVPKCRDSYTWLHLMERDDLPIEFYFILGDERLKPEPALLGHLNNHLKTCIHCEGDEPWKKRYVQNSLVFNIESWNKNFPEYKIKRIES